MSGTSVQRHFPSSEPGHRRQFDRNIMVHIAERCEMPTKAVLCRLNKPLHVTLQNVLCRRIELREPHHLDAFARYVMKSKHDVRVRSALAHLERFAYLPTITCHSTDGLRGESSLSKLSQIPQRAPNGDMLFPRLKEAKLTLAVDARVGRQAIQVPPDYTRPDTSACFLAGVQRLWLADLTVYILGDMSPALQLLGIQMLDRVVITFARGALPSLVVSWYLRRQKDLTTVVLDIEDHLADYFACPSYRSREEVANEYCSIISGQLLHGFWRERDSFPKLATLIVRLGAQQWREIIPHLQAEILRGVSHRIFDKTWLHERVTWQAGKTGRRSIISPNMLVPKESIMGLRSPNLHAFS